MATTDRVTVSDLGFGRPDAPYGTKQWALWFRGQVQSHISRLEQAPASLEASLGVVDKFKMWSLLDDPQGRPFPDFASFCAAPIPYGLGKDPKRLRGEIEDAKARVADAWKTAKPTAKAGAPKGNANAKKEGKRPLPGKDCIPAYGNRAEYLAGRIKAKAAEGDERAKAVAERISEYTSMRQAARDAGVLKPVDVLRATQGSFLKLTRDQQNHFIDWALREMKR